MKGYILAKADWEFSFASCMELVSSVVIRDVLDCRKVVLTCCLVCIKERKRFQFTIMSLIHLTISGSTASDSTRGFPIARYRPTNVVLVETQAKYAANQSYSSMIPFSLT